MKYDYLIIGSGIFGITLAEHLKRYGKSVLIIEKRHHIGGNCYTEEQNGIQVHKFGLHISHSDNTNVWNYLSRFTTFNNYRHTGKVNYKGRIFSFPINLMTLHQLWGINTPQEAADKLKEVAIPCDNPQNMEEWCLSKIGSELYETFVKYYTIKQWGKHPSELPANIIKRIPVRMTFDENYFHSAKHQGIPIGGYTQMMKNMLDGIPVELGTDFFTIKDKWRNYAKRLVYTGEIDRFFNYCFGKLEYRSLRWENEILDGDYQGCSVMNYTDEDTPFTRIVEHKHFEFSNNPKTIISKEYPVDYAGDYEPYYPINDDKNNTIYEKYKTLALNEKDIVISGRLGSYKYLDIDTTTGLAMELAEKELQ